MKIAIVHNYYGKHSGEETAIENLTAMLAKRGVSVCRFSRYSTEIENKLFGKAAAFFSGIHNPLAKKAFTEFLKNNRPDIVHIHNLYPFISPSILPVCKELCVPVVMTVHNFRMVCPNALLLSRGEICCRCLGGREYWCVLRNCENSLFKSTGYALRTAAARMLRRYYDNVDHFICLSEFQKNILSGEGLPADRVSVLPNLVRLHSEIPRGKKGDGYVAYVGRVSPEKDIRTLLEAAHGLADIPFKFAGDYHRMPEVMKNKPVNVEFLGQLGTNEIDRFYHNARMVVFATRCYEGFPSVLLETMSHGLPIICSRIGGLPEIVEEGENGLLYEPGSAAELTAHIRTLWKDAVLRAKLGEKGKDRLKLKYNAEKIIDRIILIYEKEIADKKCKD